MRSPIRPFATMGLAAALTSLAFSPVVAQAPSKSPPAAAPAMPSAPPGAGGTVSDQKLDQAAAAIARVSYLRQNYERQLAQADPADRPKIEQQGTQALAQAVKDQGLSVDEYNSIIQRAQQDPNVRQKLLKRLEPNDTGSPGTPPGAPPQRPGE